MAKKKPSYGASEDARNKQLNLVLRAQEKLGYEVRYAGWRDTEVVVPRDVRPPEPQVNRGEMRSAPTINPSRPRANVIAYAPDENRLVVVFRDGTWWQYNNVPTNIWLGLKNSPSTGRYLKSSGLDAWPDMGPADLDAMPSSIKEQISYTAQIAGSIQAGNYAKTTVNEVNEDSGSDLRG